MYEKAIWQWKKQLSNVLLSFSNVCSSNSESVQLIPSSFNEASGGVINKEVYVL